MKNETRRAGLPRLLRGAAMAAAMTVALAVTAGAVNLATEGILFQSLREIWSDGYVTCYEGLDSEGNPVQVDVCRGASVQRTEDGRMLLRAAGEEVDITGEITERGVYHFERTMESRTVAVDVAGTPEDWTLTETVTQADGTVYCCSSASEDMTGEAAVSGVVAEWEEKEADGAVRGGVVNVTEP